MQTTAEYHDWLRLATEAFKVEPKDRSHTPLDKLDQLRWRVRS